jgi:LPS-assembly lipoprotein
MKFLWVCLIAVLLTACGFHMRGSRPIPPALQTLQIQSLQSNTGFTKTLRQYCLNASLQLTDEPAHPQLRLINTTTNSSPGSMSASSQTREYRLTFTLLYQLNNTKGVIIQPPRTITATRTLLMNTNRMLGSTSEEQTLYHEMHLEVSRRLLDQLTAPKIAKNLERQP